MSTYKIEIDTESASFYNETGEHIPHYEISSILMNLANKYRRENTIGDKIIKDSNGKIVGFVAIYG